MGDWSNSVYLIGEGAVQVLLPQEDNQSTLLGPLGRGECFGEMAAGKLDMEKKAFDR